MNPILYAVIGLVAGVIMTWLIMRFLVVRQLNDEVDGLHELSLIHI